MVHPYLNYFGGAERILANMTNILSEEHEVELYSFAFSEVFLGRIERKVTLVTVPGFSPLERTSVSPFNRWTVKAYINVFLKNELITDADIINYHNIPAFWMVTGQGKKIWMCHEPQRAFYDPSINLGEKVPTFLIPAFQVAARYFIPKDKAAAERMDMILVNSTLSGKVISQIYNTESKIVRLPVDPEWKPNLLKADKIRSKYCKPDGKMILMVGGVEPTKGALPTIETLRRFLQNGEVSLVVEGNHTFSSKIRSKIQQLGLNESVFLPGVVQNIADFYQATDFILMNSQFEPFGLAAAEGMFLGKIALVSKRTGVSEIIENKINSFIFSNSNELRKLVYSLVNGSYDLEKIGKEAQKTIRSKCSPEKFRIQVKNLFSSV